MARGLVATVRTPAMMGNNHAGAIGELRIWYPRVTSTMDVASGLAVDGAPHGTVVEAGMQTAGRGRPGKAWATPGQGALLTSWIFRFPDVERHPSVMSPLIALALIRTIRKLAPDASVGYKWPNDVLIDDKKVAGILLTSRRTADEIVVIAGIGVNVSRDSVPDDIGAISLDEWRIGICVHHLRVLLGIELGSILAEPGAVSRLRTGDLDELRSALVWKDHDVDVVTSDSTVAGRLVTVAADGSLRLRRADTGEIQSMHVGEIVRGPRKIVQSTA